MKPRLFVMRLFSSLSCLVLCSISVFSQIGSTPGAEETLRKLEYDWLMAEFRLDTATISGMMDEHFIAIGANSISSKSQELTGIFEHMSQRVKNKHVVDSLYFEDLHIQIHGATAIVTFVSVTRGSIKDVPFSNRRTRMYDVWMKKDGIWKAISSQVTPL